MVASATAQVAEGRRLTIAAGCSSCHRIGETGYDGPGPDLSRIGRALPAAGIRRAMTEPVAPLTSYAAQGDDRLDAIAAYLAALSG